MRRLWKGYIRFSLATIPIQIFNAVEKGNDISFKQLYNVDNGRVRYKKVCSTCAVEVPYSDIVKDHEYELGQFVILNKEEFSSIKLKSTRVIKVDYRNNQEGMALSNWLLNKGYRFQAVTHAL